VLLNYLLSSLNSVLSNSVPSLYFSYRPLTFYYQYRYLLKLATELPHTSPTEPQYPQLTHHISYYRAITSLLSHHIPYWATTSLPTEPPLLSQHMSNHISLLYHHILYYHMLSYHIPNWATTSPLMCNHVSSWNTAIPVTSLTEQQYPLLLSHHTPYLSTTYSYLTEPPHKLLPNSQICYWALTSPIIEPPHTLLSYHIPSEPKVQYILLYHFHSHKYEYHLLN
jgi:hypothetical protein